MIGVWWILIGGEVLRLKSKGGLKYFGIKMIV